MKMEIPIRILNFIGYRILNLSTVFVLAALRLDTVHHYIPEVEAKFKADDPYDMKRVTYPLNEESFVVDIGGYNGDWAIRMYCQYSCYIDVYEPNPDMVHSAKLTFLNNKKVNVYGFGLADKNDVLTLYGKIQNASIFANNMGGKTSVMIRKASEVFNELYSNKVIDLLKINVEGSEYLILPNLIKNYDMKKIKTLQIQFHSNIEGYEEKRDEIRKELSKTHVCSWEYDYIWENWELK